MSTPTKKNLDVAGRCWMLLELVATGNPQSCATFMAVSHASPRLTTNTAGDSLCVLRLVRRHRAHPHASWKRGLDSHQRSFGYEPNGFLLSHPADRKFKRKTGSLQLARGRRAARAGRSFTLAGQGVFPCSCFSFSPGFYAGAFFWAQSLQSSPPISLPVGSQDQAPSTHGAP